MSHVYRRLVADFGRNHIIPGLTRIRDRYAETKLVRTVSDAYEDLLGIKEVKQTQQTVLKVTFLDFEFLLNWVVTTLCLSG